jgi:DNA-binding NarL/FixJ family response regulator
LTFVGESEDKARHGAARASWRSQSPSLVLRSVPSVADGTARDDDAAFGSPDRRTWAADQGHHVVACVDVRSHSIAGDQEVAPDVLWGLALRRMERCVRPADRVCMLGGSRFAVCFGNGAHRIAPNELGSRLARAMGDHLVVGATALDLRVRIGIGAGTLAVEARDLAGAAIASTRSSRGRVSARRPRRDTAASVVAVTQVPDPDAILRVAAAYELTRPRRRPSVPTGNGPASATTAHRLLRRTFFGPLDFGDHAAGPLGQRSAARTLSAETYRVSAHGAVAGLTILVVDPAVASSEMPRSAVQGVAAAARRLGVCPILSAADRPDTVVDDLSVSEADAVVVILHPDTAHVPSDSDAGTPWEHPARLARALVDAGASVIALSVGASAAAVAACVEQGAAGVLQIDALADELANVAKAPAAKANGAGRPNGNGNNGTPRGRRQLPQPFDTLVHLTSTERKVLFHMMEGRAAGDIASLLVVSLTTVRSHIRSILRKLNVNSQLAAVAIANGADPRAAATG